MGDGAAWSHVGDDARTKHSCWPRDICDGAHVGRGRPSGRRRPSSTLAGALGAEELASIPAGACGASAINAEFNGALCRGLLAARFDEPMSDHRRADVARLRAAGGDAAPDDARRKANDAEDDAARRRRAPGPRSRRRANWPRRCAARWGRRE